MRLPENKLRIIIADTCNSQVCAGNCGGDWSLPEALNTARQRISQRFGNQVELEYIDLLKVDDSEDIRKIREAVKDMPMPVLLADDRPRIAGTFDMRQLIDVIEACLEVKL
jgi:hypothetical protein